MNKEWCKIYDTEKFGQILVYKSTDDAGDRCIHVGVNLGVTSDIVGGISADFPCREDTDDCQQEGFDAVTKEFVIDFAEKYALKFTKED